MPTISVIVPIYKVEPYLCRCVDSILAQTYSNLEIWLVDDGSPDRCGVICDEYAAQDTRIRVIHKQNGGLSDARNAALDVMTGDYVTFVDSDDWIAPDAIGTMYEALIRNGAQVAVGNMIDFYEDGHTENGYCPSGTETVLTGEEILATFARPCAPNKLYEASIYRSVRFPVGRLYEDTFVYHKILAQVSRMVLTGKTAYYYFIRSGSIMHGEFNIRFTDIIDAVNDRAMWLDSIGQTKLANQNRLFIYSRTAVAYAHLKSSDPVQKKRLGEIREIYCGVYDKMMKDNSISFKQKCRLCLLRRFPALHTVLFGRKMPVSLG